MAGPSAPARGSGTARVLFLAALVAAPGAGQQEGEPAAAEPLAESQAAGERVLALTLEDALRIAIENNLDLEVEELATDIALFDAQGSWGAFDPFLAVTGSLTERMRQGSSSLSGADVLEEDTQAVDASLTVPFRTGTQVDLTYSRNNDKTNNQFAAFDVSTTDVVTAGITQSLLRGAWTRFATTDQRIAEVVYQTQRGRESEVRQRLVLDVYNAYWDLVSAIEELGVRELAVELGKQQLSRERRRLEVGAGTEVDVLQAETNVAQQEEARIQALATVGDTRDALRRLLFQRHEDDARAFLETWEWPIAPQTPLPDVGADDPATDAVDWRLSLDQALAHRPELLQRRLEIDAAEIRLTRARSDRLPVLDVGFTATGVGFDTQPTDAFESASSFEFPEYRGFVTFTMPLLNRTARNAERAARAALRTARIVYDRQEVDVLAEVRQAVRNLNYQVESVGAAKKSLSLARRQLEAEEARREIGISTTFQVLEFQQDLAEALSTERAARAAYAKAWAALGHAEGQLDERPSGAGVPDPPGPSERAQDGRTPEERSARE